MDIVQAFRSAFRRKQEKCWEKIFVVVDIHDTVLHASYHNAERYRFFPHARQALRILSQRSDVCLILWSSSYPDALQRYVDFFSRQGIRFNHVNCNPEVNNTSLQDFSHKLYFNVGIDDRFGFQPQTDWKQLKDYLTLACTDE